MYVAGDDDTLGLFVEAIGDMASATRPVPPTLDKRSTDGALSFLPIAATPEGVTDAVINLHRVAFDGMPLTGACFIHFALGETSIVKDKLAEASRITALIKAAQNTAELRAAWIDARKLLGFNYGTVVTLMSLQGARDWRYVATDAPAEFMEWYDKEGMVADDPIVRRAIQGSDAFFSDQLEHSRMTTAMLKFVFKAFLHGLTFAVGASHHSSHGFITFGIFSSRFVPSSLDRRLVGDLTHWFVTAAHDTMMRIARADALQVRKAISHGELTDQERNVLSLTAKGFMPKRIAHQMGATPRTVAYYTSSASKKLGAADRLLAVKQALLEHEITLFTAPRRWSASDQVLVTPEPCEPSPGGVNRETMTYILHSLLGAGTLTELRDITGKICAALGFERYAQVLRVTTPKHQKQFVLTNLTAPMQALGEDEHQLSSNPVMGGDIARPSPGWSAGAGGGSVVQMHPGNGKFIALTMQMRDAHGGHSTLSFANDHSGVDGDTFGVEFAAFVACRRLHEAAMRLSREQSADDYLTQREKDCLFYAAHDHDLKEIAKLLHLTPSNVRHHLSSAAHKLRVNTTSEALAKANELGLLSHNIWRHTFESAAVKVAS